MEQILRSEELVVRNKENFLRSRSYQFDNRAMFSFVKNEEAVFDRKGKRSQGRLKLNSLFLDAKGLIRGSIRKNRRKSKRKRSESFDFSMFVPPSRLDENSSDSDPDMEGYDFDTLNQEITSGPRKAIGKAGTWKNVEEIKEDQNEYASSFNKGKKKGGFGGFSGYSMKLATDEAKEENESSSSDFKPGYRMSMQ